MREAAVMVRGKVLSVIFEGDVLGIIQFMQRKNVNMSPINLLVDDILSFFLFLFWCFLILFLEKLMQLFID